MKEKFNKLADISYNSTSVAKREYKFIGRLEKLTLTAPNENDIFSARINHIGNKSKVLVIEHLFHYSTIDEIELNKIFDSSDLKNEVIEGFKIFKNINKILVVTRFRRMYDLQGVEKATFEFNRDTVESDLLAYKLGREPEVF
jgi:hypothetical protein